MRIQHNIAALNALNQYNTNNNAVSKSLQKLSSGYKINSAADNAAGLAISEKMRGQISGLNQAKDNANDGISLVQTAEGGLSETQSILQRMRELAVQSSNGTYQNETDRSNLNLESNALVQEINRISSSTAFNKINLLDGSLENGAVAVPTGTGNIGLVAGSGTAVTATGLPDGTSVNFVTQNNGVTNTAAYSATNKTLTISLATGSGSAATYTSTDINNLIKTATGDTVPDGVSVSFTGNISAGDGVTTGSKLGTIVLATPTVTAPTTAQDVYGTDSSFKLSATMTGHTGVTQFAFTSVDPTSAPVGVTNNNGQVSVALDQGKSYSASDINDMLKAADIDFQASFDGSKTGAAIATGFGTKSVIDGTGTAASGLTFQIGANGSDAERVTLNIGDMSASGLGVNNVSIATADDATGAIATIDSAINKVSSTRANLGAMQNRLEHTVNNLSTTSENLTSAESQIRDVDMAEEMMNMTKNNILSQAAQSMLAQANTMPQNVLQLLK